MAQRVILTHFGIHSTMIFQEWRLELRIVHHQASRTFYRAKNIDKLIYRRSQHVLADRQLADSAQRVITNRFFQVLALRAGQRQKRPAARKLISHEEPVCKQQRRQENRSRIQMNRRIVPIT